MQKPLSMLWCRRTTLVALSLLPWLFGYSLMSVGSRPRTPLMDAVRANQVAEVQTLLARDVDVNEEAAYGWTALWEAVDGGYVPLITMLIEAGANVNATLDSGAFLLQRAIGYERQPGRSAELVALLLTHGADVRARDASGRTVLHSAALGDRTGDVVRLLLAAGADPNAADCAGNVPLGRAVGHPNYGPPKGSLPVIRALLEAGARPPWIAVPRIRTLAAQNAQVLALLDRAPTAASTRYAGSCRSPEGASERALALKGWSDRHHLPLPLGLCIVLVGFPFLLATLTSPAGFLCLFGFATKDRVLVRWSLGLFLFILIAHVLALIWGVMQD